MCVNLLSVSRIHLSVLIQSELLSSNPAWTPQIKLNSTLLHIHNPVLSLCHSSLGGNDADTCINCFLLSSSELCSYAAVLSNSGKCSSGKHCTPLMTMVYSIPSQRLPSWTPSNWQSGGWSWNRQERMVRSKHIYTQQRSGEWQIYIITISKKKISAGIF